MTESLYLRTTYSDVRKTSPNSLLSKAKKLAAPVIAALAISGCTTSPAPGGNGNTTTTQPGIEMLNPEVADKVYITGCDSNTTGDYSLLNNQPYSYADELKNRGARKVIKAAVNGSAIDTYTPTLAEQAVMDEINNGENAADIKVLSQCVTNAISNGMSVEETVQRNLDTAETLESIGVEVIFLETPPIQPGSVIDQLKPWANNDISQVNSALQNATIAGNVDYIDYPNQFGYADPIHIGPTTQNAYAANIVSTLNQQP